MKEDLRVLRDLRGSADLELWVMDRLCRGGGVGLPRRSPRSAGAEAWGFSDLSGGPRSLQAAGTTKGEMLRKSAISG